MSGSSSQRNDGCNVDACELLLHKAKMSRTDPHLALLEVQLHSANRKVVQDLLDSRFERRIVCLIPGDEFLHDPSQCQGRQSLMGNSHPLTMTSPDENRVIAEEIAPQAFWMSCGVAAATDDLKQPIPSLVPDLLT